MHQKLHYEEILNLLLARGGSVTERQIRHAWFNWSGGKTTKEK